jgi:hypothetical protein
VVDGATVPTWHVTLQATMPANQRELYLRNGGQPFPKEQVQAASKELEEFVGILEEGLMATGKLIKLYGGQLVNLAPPSNYYGELNSYAKRLPKNRNTPPNQGSTQDWDKLY